MKLRLICLLLVFSLLLCGCGGTKASVDQGYTFTDDLGREVTVQNSRRTAALLGSFAQIWLLAGGEVCACPDDAWKDLDLDLPEDTVNLGSTENLNLEMLLASQPEFILASTNRKQNVQWQETLEATGIPVAYFDVADFEDYLRILEICTELTGRQDCYETHGTEVQAQIRQVIRASEIRLETEPAPRVLCLVASASSVRTKTSQENLMAAMLTRLGCENIADTNGALLDHLSMEYILQEDPDMIFLVQRGDDTEGTQEYVSRYLMEDPAWSRLQAVRNDRVYFMDKKLFNLKPNHRWGEAYEILEEILTNG